MIQAGLNPFDLWKKLPSGVEEPCPAVAGPVVPGVVGQPTPPPYPPDGPRQTLVPWEVSAAAPSDLPNSDPSMPGALVPWNLD